MVTIYTIAFNEELMMPYFIKHYRKMFPNCRIVVYDNESTDRTVEIVNSFPNTEVRTYSTGGKLNDEVYLEIKNNCWKDAQTDWVLVCDVDEHLYITDKQLKNDEYFGITAIYGNAFNMVGTFQAENEIDIEKIVLGVRADSYDKLFLFNKKYITEINYGPGCHSCSPKGRIINIHGLYTTKHYKYIHPDYMVRRHKLFASRLSEINLKKGFGYHYLYSEEKIREEFKQAREQAHEIY